MKVVCPFCDSYIEADENMNCPNCGGSVSAEVKDAEERCRREDSERREAEAAQQQKMQEEARDQRLLELIIGAFAGAVGTRRGRGLIRFIMNMISRGKKGGMF